MRGEGRATKGKVLDRFDFAENLNDFRPSDSDYDRDCLV